MKSSTAGLALWMMATGPALLPSAATWAQPGPTVARTVAPRATGVELVERAAERRRR